VAPGSTDRVLHSWSSGLSGPGQIGIGRVLRVVDLAHVASLLVRLVRV
jgi:hypothetical protein